MAQIELRGYVIGMVGTNTYMVTNKDTKETLIIDPAERADFLASEIRKNELKPVAILLTHGHFDHIMAVNELRDEFGIKVYAHEDEVDILADPNLNSSSMAGQRYTTSADELLKDGQDLSLAGIDMKIIHTPGHTKGGCCFYMPQEGVIFVGDTLFNGSIGRTDFPTGSMSQLIRGVEEKLFTLPEDTVVYPGHMSETSIGQEKKYNPFFR